MQERKVGSQTRLNLRQLGEPDIEVDYWVELHLVHSSTEPAHAGHLLVAPEPLRVQCQEEAAAAEAVEVQPVTQSRRKTSWSESRS